MNPVRTVLADLVDRRLWPVALALVAALVAVPVMLGGGSDPSSTPASDPAASAPAGTPVAQAAISVSTPSTARQNRPGAVRNPFKQHKVEPLPDTATNPQPTVPAPSPSFDSPSFPIGGGTPSYPITPVVPGSGGGRRDETPATVWRVNLRFGDAGDQKVRHDIPRLTPLPSTTDPFFIFLGVLSDHKTAVFLISSDATATGDGTCKPSPDQCDTIEMKAGDTEFFDVAQGNAGIVQYELDLLKVFKDKVSSSAAAAHAARRVSKGGKDVVHELKAEGDDSMERYIYSYKRGVLVRRHGLDVKASASSSGSAADSGAHSSAFAVPTWGSYPQ